MRLEPFNPTLLVFVSTDRKFIIDEIEAFTGAKIQEAIIPTLDFTKPSTLDFGRTQVLNLCTWEGSVENYGTLAHELQHIMNNVLDFVGQGRTDSEWEAYFIGNLTRKVLSNIELCSKK